MDINASALQRHRLLCNRRITMPYYGRDITKNTSIHMGYSFRFALGFTITRYGFDLDLVSNQSRTSQSKAWTKASVCLSLIIHRTCACSNSVPIRYCYVDPTGLKRTHRCCWGESNNQSVVRVYICNYLR